MSSLNYSTKLMVNLDQICKVEEFDEFFRLYLVSGDVEEVDRRSFTSAIKSSGAQYMAFADEDVTPTGFDAVSDDDIEDVSDLSDGHMVDEAHLAEPTAGNAVVEGSDVIDPRDVLANMSKEQLIKVLATLKA